MTKLPNSIIFFNLLDLSVSSDPPDSFFPESSHWLLEHWALLVLPSTLLWFTLNFFFCLLLLCPFTNVGFHFLSLYSVSMSNSIQFPKNFNYYLFSDICFKLQPFSQASDAHAELPTELPYMDIPVTIFHIQYVFIEFLITFLLPSFLFHILIHTYS